jgi:hypothetical protein
MKIRFTLVLVLLVLMLLGTGAGALAAPRYRVEGGTLAGGGYRLTSVEPPADNVAAGGVYRLLGPVAPEQLNSGCCCTYLPCALRNK